MGDTESDVWNVTRYAFGAICLVTAAAGTFLQIWAGRLASKSMPEERSPAGVIEGPDMEVYKAWRVGYVRRNRFATESASLHVVSGLVLYISVIAALTINFPWFFGLGITGAVMLTIWAIIVAYKLSKQISRAKADEAEAERESKAAPIR